MTSANQRPSSSRSVSTLNVITVSISPSTTILRTAPSPCPLPPSGAREVECLLLD
jgi:hypothetical protein